LKNKKKKDKENKGGERRREILKITLVVKVHEPSTRVSLALKCLKLIEAKFFSKVSKKVAATVLSFEGIKPHLT